MSLLNRKKTKDYALEVSAATRGGRFTRVSKGFLDRIEAKMRSIILHEVHAHPSTGVTLK